MRKKERTEFGAPFPHRASTGPLAKMSVPDGHFFLNHSCAPLMSSFETLSLLVVGVLLELGLPSCWRTSEGLSSATSGKE